MKIEFNFVQGKYSKEGQYTRDLIKLAEPPAGCNSYINKVVICFPLFICPIIPHEP